MGPASGVGSSSRGVDVDGRACMHAAAVLSRNDISNLQRCRSSTVHQRPEVCRLFVVHSCAPSFLHTSHHAHRGQTRSSPDLSSRLLTARARAPQRTTTRVAHGRDDAPPLRRRRHRRARATVHARRTSGDQTRATSIVESTRILLKAGKEKCVFFLSGFFTWQGIQNNPW